MPTLPCLTFWSSIPLFVSVSVLWHYWIWRDWVTHLYSQAILFNFRESLEDLEQSEIRTMLLCLPNMRIERVSVLPLCLCADGLYTPAILGIGWGIQLATWKYGATTLGRWRISITHDPLRLAFSQSLTHYLLHSPSSFSFPVIHLHHIL